MGLHVSTPLSHLQALVYHVYISSKRGPEDDSVESKHVVPISHYMFNITTVVFDGPSPPFIFKEVFDEQKYSIG